MSSRKTKIGAGLFIALAAAVSSVWFWQQTIVPFRFMEGKACKIDTASPLIGVTTYELDGNWPQTAKEAEKELTRLGYTPTIFVTNDAGIAFAHPSRKGVSRLIKEDVWLIPERPGPLASSGRRCKIIVRIDKIVEVPSVWDRILATFARR